MPPPPLDQNDRSRTQNFYQNSFRQLSSVQQKQVGLLVGTAVADAAAYGTNGLSALEIANYEREVLKYDAVYEAEMAALRKPATPASSGADAAQSALGRPPLPPQQQDLRSPLVFVRPPSHSATQDAPPQPNGTASPLAFHSFSYQLFFDLLRAMSGMRGDVRLGDVGGRWIASAQAVANMSPALYAGEAGSLLHTLCALLPVPTTYPYASDVAMREYVAEFVDLLTRRPPLGKEGSRQLVLELGDGRKPLMTTVAEAQAAEQALAKDLTLSALSVVIRFLQSNPNPVRNGAFMAIPGTADIFPTDVAAFVPSTKHPGYGGVPPAALTVAASQPQTASSHSDSIDLLQHRRSINEALLARYRATMTAGDSLPLHPQAAMTVASSSRNLLSVRPVLQDALTIRESISIVRSARSFESGVVQAIRMGGPTAQRAMLVGAMLGAKLGARHIPLPWLSATVDYQPVSTMAIEVAQWAWNPANRRA